METLFIMLLVAMVVFLIYKGIIVILSKLLRKIMKITKEKEGLFDLWISIAMQILFIGIWIACMDIMAQKNEINNLVGYISFCLIGIFCVIWCYFSWDVDHILVKPRKARPEDRKAKKIVLYALILVFVLCQGYFQTLHILDPSVEVDILFSVTNYSVIVGAIALDRLLNQVL